MAKQTDDVAAPFGMFLRPTGKGHAQRYGDSRPMGYAGRDDDGRVVIDTSIVIALSHTEAHRYRREYGRQIDEGACVEASVEEYKAFIKASHEAEKKAQKEAEAAQKKADAAAKQADEDAIERNAKALKTLRAKQRADAKKAQKETTGATETGGNAP